MFKNCCFKSLLLVQIHGGAVFAITAKGVRAECSYSLPVPYLSETDAEFDCADVPCWDLEQCKFLKNKKSKCEYLEDDLY